MSLDQLKAFLNRVQNEASLRQAVMAAATADDVAQIAAELGYQFSGDELLRISGKKLGRITVRKQEIPVEYNRGAENVSPLLFLPTQQQSTLPRPQTETRHQSIKRLTARARKERISRHLRQRATQWIFNTDNRCIQRGQSDHAITCLKHQTADGIHSHTCIHKVDMAKKLEQGVATGVIKTWPRTAQAHIWTLRSATTSPPDHPGC